jgi:predicted helicase
MRLSKDKTTLIYNQLIDQYQVSTDKRSGITNDPNRAEDPQYILRLIGQVITVSLETVKIVRCRRSGCLTRPWCCGS